MKQIQIVNAINDEPITTIDIPASERLKLVDLGNDDPGRPAGALQSLWLVADGQEVDGMRVSLVGCSANNLIIDLTGANVSGMQIMLATLLTLAGMQ